MRTLTKYKIYAAITTIALFLAETDNTTDTNTTTAATDVATTTTAIINNLIQALMPLLFVVLILGVFMKLFDKIGGIVRAAKIYFVKLGSGLVAALVFLVGETETFDVSSMTSLLTSLIGIIIPILFIMMVFGIIERLFNKLT